MCFFAIKSFIIRVKLILSVSVQTIWHSWCTDSQGIELYTLYSMSDVVGNDNNSCLMHLTILLLIWADNPLPFFFHLQQITIPFFSDLHLLYAIFLINYYRFDY